MGKSGLTYSRDLEQRQTEKEPGLASVQKVSSVRQVRALVQSLEFAARLCCLPIT